MNDAHWVLDTLSEELKMAELMLHDFGTGQTIFPVIDPDGSYLTSSVFFVTVPGLFPKPVMQVSFTYTESHLLRELTVERVKTAFDKLATKINEGAPMPKIIPIRKLLE
jgi:hypothetical protein